MNKRAFIKTQNPVVASIEEPPIDHGVEWVVWYKNKNSCERRKAVLARCNRLGQEFKTS